MVGQLHPPIPRAIQRRGLSGLPYLPKIIIFIGDRAQSAGPGERATLPRKVLLFWVGQGRPARPKPMFVGVLQVFLVYHGLAVAYHPGGKLLQYYTFSAPYGREGFPLLGDF